LRFLWYFQVNMMKRYTLKIATAKTEKSLKINYNKELNKSQVKAVKTIDGPLLVIAGAGSGKTRTLVYRVAMLVEKGIKPEHILLLTFTRKAAQEMIRRASVILDERCGRISGGTFHSFANSVLRKYANFIGFDNNFTILDRSDAEDVIHLIRTKLGLHRSKSRFPRKKAILNIISKSINKDCSLQDVLEIEYPHYIKALPDVEKIYEEYKQYKKSRSLMDYDDLLIFLKALLEKNDDIRVKLSNFYKYIMIDEYQDTNKLQASIAYLLASEHKNIMAVGDDSQSIYSFRGANFRNIMDFPKLFPNAKIITLEQNYRSTQPILNLTNKIIEYAKEKYSKVLFTTKKGNQKPVFIEAQNENYQSKFVVQRVLELREEGIPLNDIAILFRNGWHSNDLEVELASRDIPFKKYGGFKFIETAHVKDAIAYLRIVFNPLDSVSWHRVLLLIEGVGPKTANEIISKTVDNRKRRELLKTDGLTKKRYYKNLEDLFSLIKIISAKSISLSEKIGILLKYYKPLLKNKYDDFNKRINDLDSLVRIAERYDGLEQFLTDMVLEPIEASQVDATAADREEGELILSTIHSAKGLEWHTVFLISAVDGFLPSLYSFGSEEEIEEERRLLYVATTRAKENLYLIKPEIEHAGRNYFEQSFSEFSRVSRFLEEGNILEKYVEKWAIDEEQENEIK